MAGNLSDLVRKYRAEICTRAYDWRLQLGDSVLASEAVLQQRYSRVLDVLLLSLEESGAAPQQWAHAQAQQDVAANRTVADGLCDMDDVAAMIRHCIQSHLWRKRARRRALIQLDTILDRLRRCYVEAHATLSSEMNERMHASIMAVHHADSFEETLTHILTSALQISDAPYVALCLSEEDAEDRVVAMDCETMCVRRHDTPPPWVAALVAALRDQACQSGRSQVVIGQTLSAAPVDGDRRFGTLLGVPLVALHLTLGHLILAWEDKATGESEAGQGRVETFAAHASRAIELSRRYRRLHHHNTELHTLREMAEQIGYTLNDDALVLRMLDHLARVVPLDVSASILVSDNLRKLYMKPDRPMTGTVRDEIERRLRQALMLMSEKGAALQKDDLFVRTLSSPQPTPHKRVITRLGTTLQVPLVTGERREVVGLLFVGAEQDHAFTEEHIRLLDAVADQASLSLQQLRSQFAEAQQRLERLVEGLPEGVCVVDADYRLVLANPAARGYLSLVTDTRVGELLSYLGLRPIEQLLEPPPQGRFHEIEIDGPPSRVFAVDARPLISEPEAGGWVMVLRELTEERQMQEYMQQQEHLAAVGQLVAGVAHDFNNLLSGIISFAESLSAQAASPEIARGRLARIVEQGKRGAELVQQMLDFSRTSIQNLRPFNLVPFMDNIREILMYSLPENIRLEMSIAAEAFYISADVARVQQVLMNLTANARDAMPTGGQLRLSVSRFYCEPRKRPPCLGMTPGDWVVLSVSDTGTGIPSAVRPHILEPFFTTKGPGKGTGLGLSQVYGIVKQHKGYLDIRSEEGKGTEVLIYLPEITRVEEERPPEPTAEIPFGNGETVLLVEDESGVREGSKVLLEHLGYRVLAVDHGQQALDLYATLGDEIAVVLTDMVMPEIDGVRLFHALKEMNPQVRTVILTGYPLDEEGQQFLDQGILDWVQKPLDLATLGHTMYRMLKR